MDTNETKQDESVAAAELAAKADMAQDGSSGDEMSRLYREALAKCDDPALATAAAMNQWLFGRCAK